MSAEPSATPIKDRYARQLAEDLEQNRAQQALLTERLEQLKADEAFLLKLQGSVPAPQATPAPASPAEPAPAGPQDAASPAQDATTVPSPRGEETPPARRPRKAAAKKTPARKTAAKKTAAKKTSTAKKEKEPTLGALLQSILAGQTEPRTAAEIVSELERTHPQRARDVNTVRNTLERLVAQSRAERSKQGSTVYYSSVPDSSGPAAAQTGTESSSAAGTGEQVPATP